MMKLQANTFNSISNVVQMFTKPNCRSNELHETHYLVEPEAGIGPATYALRVRCSTTELPGRVFSF